MIFQNIFFLELLIFLSFGESNLSLSKKLNSTFLITGGLPKDDHDLGKFVASIRYRTYFRPSYGYQHFCGGTIISPTKILTAAHCLYDDDNRKTFQPFELVVVIGSTNRLTKSKSTREMDVASVKRHKKHRDDTQFADVGYLILKDEIQFDNPHVGIMNLSSSKPKPETKCTVMGWGRLFDEGPLSDRILFTDIEIYDSNFCLRRYQDEFFPGMICAGHPVKWERDSCGGDSGGPLICDDVLVGIVSWGIGCGLKRYPGVYTDVYYFRSWISMGRRMDANCFVIIFLTLIV